MYSLFFVSCIFMMQIFFSGSQTAADMPLRLVHLQNGADRFGQLGINMLHSVGNVLMHGGFGDPEFLRRFPHGGIGGNHKLCNLDRPFFDICLQTKHSSKYRLVMYMLRSGRI